MKLNSEFGMILQILITYYYQNIKNTLKANKKLQYLCTKIFLASTTCLDISTIELKIN